MASNEAPRIYVLAGVNGAGKSSIGGAAFRAFGADYYNPDEAARALMSANRGLRQPDANAAAWQQGRRLLEQAIAKRLDYAFETTLGGSTIARLLEHAASQGIEIHVWYAGLSSPELHLERVRARVRKGGHDIPEADIRRRYEHSRMNLVHLLPRLAALRALILHVEHQKIVGPADLSQTPDWAKPIVAAALNLHPGRKVRRT
jgi:predicted ABC-type ATPase